MGWIIPIFIVSTGSIIGIVFFDKKYEEALPYTGSAIIALLFLFGFFGNLLSGSYFLCIVAFIVYLVSAVYYFRRKKNNFLQNLLSDGFWLFIILSLFSIISVYGRVAAEWDEFTHWADIVKAMYMLDDFGTNPKANSFFACYPPGMALFQYFIEKTVTLGNSEMYQEWLLYFSYHLLEFSFLVPLWSKICEGSSKRMCEAAIREGVFSIEVVLESAKRICVIAATIFLIPVVFYLGKYMSIYIDSFLGILYGAGLIELYIEKDLKKCMLYEICICMMLVLAKDAGLLFAVFLLISYIIKYYIQRRLEWRGVVFSLSVGLSIALPKILWNRIVTRSNAAIIFGNGYDLKQFWEIILGRDTTYRQEAYRIFWKTFLEKPVEIPVLYPLGISLSHALMFLVFIILCGFIMHYNKRKAPCDRWNTYSICIGAMVGLLIYIIGLCATYVFNFSENEALGMASFERYINIGYLGVGSFIAYCLWEIVYRKTKAGKSKKIFSFYMICVLVALTAYLGYCRKNAKASLDTREQYMPIVWEIEKNADGNSKICVISQGNEGYDFWYLKYLCRPDIVGPIWSIKSETEDEKYGVQYTAEEWQELLVSEYDFVALYRLDDAFLSDYAGLFSDRNQIEVNEVYRVNKQTGLLEKCY
ncbi:MAG: hypothetical protein ACI4S2_15240 [Lachnospiraceae bacterium]